MEKVTLIMKNANFLQLDAYQSPIEDGALVIQDNIIKDFGKTNEMLSKYFSDNVIDVSDKILMPGLVDCHNHLGNWNMYPIIAENGQNIIKQPQRLLDIIYPAYTLIEEKDCYDINMMGYLNAIKTGTTTVANAFIWTDAIGKASLDSGLRVDLAPCLNQAIEHPDSKSASDDLVRTEAMIKKWHNAGNGRIKYRIQPEISFYCEEWFFEECAKLSEKYDVGLGTHIAEDVTSSQKAAKIWPKGEIEKMYRTGFMGPRTLFYHSCLLSDNDLKMFKETKSSVAHCPVSNLKRGLVARVPEMIDMGIKVGYGVDYPNNDLFNVMRIASLIHTILPDDKKGITDRQSFELATQGGADALGIGKDVGSIAIGKKADVITLDVSQNTRLFPLTPQTVVNMMRLNGSGGDVSDVIVDGKIVMRDKKVLTIDEKEVIRKGRLQQNKFMEKYNQYKKDGKEFVKVRDMNLMSISNEY